jgi:large subunit ribosomal protein L12
MENIYSALLLHKAGKKISEKNIQKILKAAGVDIDEDQVAKLVAGLKQTDIDEIIKSASAAPVAAAVGAPAAASGGAPQEAEEEEEEEEEEDDEVAGIGSLF